MPRTPIDYSKSVIYKIEHIDKPELVYVGSTTDFTKRKCQHKNTCNNSNHKQYNLKLYQMIRYNDGWESFIIMIICEFPCISKTELLIEEEKYRKKLQANLNSNCAYRTINEKTEQVKDYNKEYYKTNKEQIKEQKKEYHETNKNVILEKAKEYYTINKQIIIKKTKEYRENNKNKINEQAKEYYQHNKEQIKEKGKEKITCECGSIFRKSDKLRHEKTIKHSQFIQQN